MDAFSTFMDPPREYTLIPFWFLNDDLQEAELIRQLEEFAAHGVYGFVPHARIGLPESIGFMSDRWLELIKVCVDHAAANDMTVVLYDEGMYPSGSCCGQVVAANPRFATRCLQQRPRGAALADDEEIVAKDDAHVYVNCRSMGHIRGVHYGQDDGQPGAPPSGDLLNPESVGTFFNLVLDRFYGALQEHFGKAVVAVFTDEPSVLGRGHLKDVRPWTWGFETFLNEYLGYEFAPQVPVLFNDQHPDYARIDRDFRRAVDARLQQVYYAPYSKWCEAHGVALTGHPSGPDDIGVMRYFQMPGQDIVWRYIEPFQDKSLEGEQSTMAKCSVSAQRHYGRARNINECFGAYGWEFTYDEMLWVTNWLLVRGVNCLMPHAFYYSVRDARRDERPPDVGPNNVWWTEYKTYADYCRRMCWLLSQGRQVCDFAILGSEQSLPWRAARVMFEHQRDFNYLDAQTLLERCTVDADGVRINDMHYRGVIVDGADYATQEVMKALRPMIDAGRVVAFRDGVDGVDRVATNADALVAALDAIAPPDVVLAPASKALRFTHMQQDGGDFYVFANEGRETVESALAVAAPGARTWWDPMAAAKLDRPGDRIRLEPYQILVLHCAEA